MAEVSREVRRDGGITKKLAEKMPNVELTWAAKLMC